MDSERSEHGGIVHCPSYRSVWASPFLCHCASTSDDQPLELAHRLPGFLSSTAPDAIQLAALTTNVVSESQSTRLTTPPSEPSQALKQKQPSRCLPPGTGLLVIFELGEVLAKSRQWEAVRSSDSESSADCSHFVKLITSQHERAVTAPASKTGWVQSSSVRVARRIC